MKIRRCMLLLAWAALALQVQAADSLESREGALAAKLRCVVCQNQTVAESQAPIAKDMRHEIRAQLAQGRSDDEVVAFFEQRYGSFVRYTPPWRASTWLLWCGPFLAVLAGFVLLRKTLKQRASGPVPLTPAERARAKDWLDQADEENRP